MRKPAEFSPHWYFVPFSASFIFFIDFFYENI